MLKHQCCRRVYKQTGRWSPLHRSKTNSITNPLIFLEKYLKKFLNVKITSAYFQRNICSNVTNDQTLWRIFVITQKIRLWITLFVELLGLFLKYASFSFNIIMFMFLACVPIFGDSFWALTVRLCINEQWKDFV